MMNFLFPFLAFISMLYFILYLIHNLTENEEHNNPLIILIPLVSLGILFFNANYQDGSAETESNLPSWLNLALKIYRVVLLLLTLMMVYRILHEFSLDINVIIYLATLILFSLIYALTAWVSKDKEKIGIQRGNLYTALFFLIILFLINLPYIPIAFNVGAQVNKSELMTSQSK